MAEDKTLQTPEVPAWLTDQDMPASLRETTDRREEADGDALWAEMTADSSAAVGVGTAPTPSPAPGPRPRAPKAAPPAVEGDVTPEVDASFGAEQTTIPGVEIPVPSIADTWDFFRELPIKTVLGGMFDAGQEMLETMADYMDWAGEQANNPGFMGVLAQQFIPGALAVKIGKEGRPDLDLEKGVKGTFPEIEEPSTLAGQMGRGVVQFVTAMAGPAKGLKAAGLGTMARSMLAGAIADGTAFDPHEENLANFLQEHTDLLKPVTDFLAVKEDDSDAMGRIKKVLEGAGAGFIVDGFIKTLRIIKAARKARGTKIPTDELYGTAPLPDDAFDPLGKTGKPLLEAVEVDDVLREKLKAGAEEIVDIPPGVLLEADKGRGIFVNMARINTSDDVKQVIKTAADLFADPIDVARGGEKVTQKAMQELSDAMGFTVDDLLRRRAGEPFNFKEALAARKLWAASGENLRQLAAKAADPATSSNLDLFNFRRGMALHQSIQKEVIAARTETARALNSWRIPVGSGEEQARALNSMMDANGGDMLSRRFAQRIASADKAGLLDEAALGKLADKGAVARTYDGFMEAWVNGLLSNPMTHAVNTMSNTMVIGQSMVERAAAGQMAKLMGDTDGVIAGEAMAQMIGINEGLKDIWRTMGKHLRMTTAKVRGDKAAVEEISKGISMPAPGLDLSKIDLPVQQAINGQAFGLSTGSFKDPSNWLGNTADAMGSAIRLPGKALNVEDQFFKTLGYRMELQAQAFRTASKEGLEGAAMKRRMWEIVENPPAEIRLSAVDNALYQTFTNNLEATGRAFTTFVNRVPGGRIIFPFIRTPANIFKYTFKDRTPLGLLSAKTRAEIAEGGAKGQIAQSRMAIGIASMLAVTDLVYGGHITGGGPPDKKSKDAMLRQGWQPDSIKIGDRFFSHQRTDPFASTVATAARIAEFIQWAGKEQEDDIELGELAAAMAWAMSDVMINKTYMQGLSNIVEAANDPTRYGAAYMEGLAGSLIPAGVAQISRTEDPYMKEVNGMLESMQSRTPGWGPELPNVRDLWGREITYRSGLGWMFDALSPIYSRRENPSEIDTEMIRLDMSAKKPNRTIGYEGGVKINLEHHPWIYDRYVELSGNNTENSDPATGLGAKDFLDSLVRGDLPQSEVYRLRTDGEDGGKAQMIRGEMARFRMMARRQLLREFPELNELVEQQRQDIIDERLQAISQ